MSECRKVEPMFAPYVDGQAEPHMRAEVERHLGHCPPCRDRVATERVAREVLVARRESLHCTASADLRRRCAAQVLRQAQDTPLRQAQGRPLRQAQGTPLRQAQGQPLHSRRRGIISRTFIPVSIAASLLLILGTISFLGLNGGVELFAAQLAVDHVKCHWLADEHARPDPVLLSKEWKQEKGWPVAVPPGTPQYDLQLIGMRQCGSTEGRNAHIMYRWHGNPLSVYVMPQQAKDATADEQFVHKAGQETIIWNEGGRTYAVVANASRRELEPIVQYVKLNAHSW